MRNAESWAGEFIANGLIKTDISRPVLVQLIAQIQNEVKDELTKNIIRHVSMAIGELDNA